MSTIVFHHPYIVSVVLRSNFRFFSHSLILSTNIYILVFPWSLPISANWSIRSWLHDYISFFFYKNYCRHDTYWILMAFIIAASAIIKVCWLHGLYRHLYTKLIYWHSVVILYTHGSLLNKRSRISNLGCHDSNLLCLLYKEYIQNCRRYRAVT